MTKAPRCTATIGLPPYESDCELEPGHPGTHVVHWSEPGDTDDRYVCPCPEHIGDHCQAEPPALQSCHWTRPDVCGFIDPANCATHGGYSETVPFSRNRSTEVAP